MQVICKEEVIAVQPLQGNPVFMRVQVNASNATCNFTFSEDGITFRPIAQSFRAKLDKL